MSSLNFPNRTESSERLFNPWRHWLIGLSILFVILPLAAREKSDKVVYGAGLNVEIESPESEVLQAVEDVADDGIIQGTKEYNKDENLGGAASATSSALYPAWTGPGKVFYKVRAEALDPRNFKEGGDVGTVAVRYVVHGIAPGKTTLRIDALYVEDFRRTIHPSNGMVESSEYKDITDHLDQMHLRRKETEESSQKREQDLAQRELLRSSDDKNNDSNNASRLAAAKLSSQTLEQHVQDLRHTVERRVAASGAALKSAPFHSASTLKMLTPGSDVVILVVTQYWLGIETQDGQHGWIFHEQLEALP